MSVLDHIVLDEARYDLQDTDGRAMLAPTEDSTTASAAHAAGSYFVYGGILYKATADIAQGGTITPNTNCAAATVGGEVSDLKSDMNLEQLGEVEASTADIVQGSYSWNSNGGEANRISLHRVYPVYPGMIIEFTPGTVIDRIYCRKYDAAMTNIGNVGWGSSSINVNWTGYAILVMANSNQNNITPSDYDAHVKFISKHDAKITGAIEDIRAYPYSLDAWEQGGIDASSGVNASTALSTQIRQTIDPLYTLGKNYMFYAKPGYAFFAYAYDYQGSYVGLYNTSGNYVRNGTNAARLTKFVGDYGRYGYRFVLFQEDNSNILPEEAENFCFTELGALTEPDYHQIASNYNEEMSRTGSLRINQDFWEIGQILTSNKGWFYPENGSGALSRVRPKKGYYLELQAGDIISLTDYTGVRYHAGYRIGTEYYTFSSWKTADTVVPYTGEYIITIATRDDSAITAKSDLLDLLRITRRVNNAAYFNVKDYGAYGNGSHNDKTEVQDALDACNAAGGGTVFFPSGTYKINSGLIFYSNTHILLDGGATILRGGTYNMMLQTYCTNETLEYNGVHDVIIEGGVIDAGTGISQGCVPIGLIHAKNITIRGVTLKHNNGAYHCVDICGCKNVIIENCICEDQLTTNSHAECLQFDSPTARGTFPSSQLTENANTFDGTITQSVEVKGCKFYLNSVSPACGNHNTSPCKNILIHDNFIVGESGSYGAISFDDPEGSSNATTQVMIHNNILEGCTYGFNFSTNGTGKIYVRDNIFKGIGTLKRNPNSPVGVFSDNVELD